MRIFITGALGQLGMALQASLEGNELTPADLPDLDVTDYQATVNSIANINPDVVIHCAAYTDVDGCARDPSLAYRVNSLGAQNVALACLESGAAMVHISTNEVFAGENADGYEEWMAARPVNAYGRSKKAAEYYVRGILSRAYIVRTAWLYSPGGSNFVHAIVRAAEENGELRIVADEVSNPTYVYDLAQAIGSLIATGRFGTYHLVNEGWCSRLQFGREVLRLKGLDHIAVRPILSSDYIRVSEPPLYCPLKNTAAAAIGIRLRPWQEALADYLSEHD